MMASKPTDVISNVSIGFILLHNNSNMQISVIIAISYHRFRRECRISPSHESSEEKYCMVFNVN